jgi:2,3,4,5-tetrahydropyridine-2-carboxylate N-succinyltransferase
MNRLTAEEIQSLRELIEIGSGHTGELSENIKNAVYTTMKQLDFGALRVAEPSHENTLHPGGRPVWITHQWVKKAILLYFRIQAITPMRAGDLEFMDKIPLKRWTTADGVRVVPPAVARFGAHIASGAVLMPSYVNIGAHVGTGTMVDTWATVGSCAQVGAHVHLSGGVGIGGVLEPVQAQPVIIEDHTFIGSRAIIVEGVHVGKGAVIGAGVTLTASTKIIDVTGTSAVQHEGYVPENSVVIPGTLNKTFPSGDFGVPCALIIGQRKESTDRKTSLNQTLREFNVPV